MTQLTRPRLDRVKNTLGAGEPSFGLIATIPSIQVMQLLAHSGFDWMLLQRAAEGFLKEVRGSRG
jgi:2-keto-3-deoxy-L-rhamnonate aldolase RhmA